MKLIEKAGKSEGAPTGAYVAKRSPSTPQISGSAPRGPVFLRGGCIFFVTTRAPINETVEG